MPEIPGEATTLNTQVPRAVSPLQTRGTVLLSKVFLLTEAAHALGTLLFCIWFHIFSVSDQMMSFLEQWYRSRLLVGINPWHALIAGLFFCEIWNMKMSLARFPG